VARALLTDEAKADVRALAAEDREVAREALRLAKQLEDEPYLGERLREKSNLKPLARAEMRKVKFDPPGRRESARPRHRYRLLYRTEPHEGSPETLVVMAGGQGRRVPGRDDTRGAPTTRASPHTPYPTARLTQSAHLSHGSCAGINPVWNVWTRIQPLAASMGSPASHRRLGLGQFRSHRVEPLSELK
jgi:hypothetical protein